MLQFNRDPFARTNTYRKTIMFGECKWCGTRADEKRNGRLYRYSVQGDAQRSNSVSWSPIFCSKSCWQSWES